MKTMSKKQFYIIIATIFVIFLSQTIVYAALSTTIKVTGDAYARVDADVRITNFELSELSENAVSSYEEFNKDTLESSVTFQNDDSYIIYKVEVTNYGTTSSGISSITGLQDGLTLELIDYNLKDKICDTNNNCSTLATKTFYIKVTGSTGTYNLSLNFNFQNFYSITYKNLSDDSYPTEIIGGDTLSLDVSTSIMNKFYAENSEGSLTTTLSSNILTVENIMSDLSITAEQENIFSYTGDYQTFTIPANAIYKVELWGAGGNICGASGKGGYTSGEIEFNKDTELYLYVGGQGTSITKAGSAEDAVGYNGGGAPDNSGYTSGDARCGGHGATDIRLVSGEWDDFESLKSRIMVAGGGGAYSQAYGGASGGLNGYAGEDRLSSTTGEITSCSGTGGTQTSGGIGSYSSTFKGQGENGSFGKGGAGFNYASGGGGGYYGGAGGARNTIDGGGGGGSSFISGHNGCVAIKETSTSDAIEVVEDSTGIACDNGTTDITCSYHYSGYIFTNTIIIDGEGYNWTTEIGSEIVNMPSPTDSTLTITGNSTTGYAKITLKELLEE